MRPLASGETAMTRLVIDHKVRDYAAWRPVYDAHEASRRGAGLSDARVFRSTEDPNDVVVIADVADPARAREWIGSDDLRTAMKTAGVVGEPTISFVD
jgi:hypothetical protein